VYCKRSDEGYTKKEKYKYLKSIEEEEEKTKK
jgi:hypothetical protein